MYPTGKKLLEDYESYLSELNNDEFSISIDSFNVFNKSAFKFSELFNGTTALAISSPECSVSSELMRLFDVSVTHETNSNNYSDQIALCVLIQ